MRTKKEMLDLIINTAENNELIRAVVMGGSRVYGKKEDIFQDFDIVYIVNNLEPFCDNMDFIKQFGKILMLQMPNEENPESFTHFTYLTQFTDGNRLDLCVCSLEKFSEFMYDEPHKLILDKDGSLPELSADDKMYHVKPPSENDYFSCCNNFWWCSMNVAKEIWRDELSCAFMYFDEIKKELHKMLDWYIGMKYDFAISIGKSGKYYKDYFSEQQYDMYKATYTNAEYSEVWKALFKMGDLFRSVALGVGIHFNYSYLHEDDRKVSAHLKHVRNLPKDAKEVY